MLRRKINSVLITETEIHNMNDKTKENQPEWLRTLKIKTGASSYETSEDIYAEDCMKRLGLDFVVVRGFALNQLRPVDARSNPSRAKEPFDVNYAESLAAKISNGERLPRMVVYQKTPGDACDLAGGFNRNAGYSIIGATHVDVYFIRPDRTLKNEIEVLLPWMLNLNGTNTVPKERYIEKAIELVDRKEMTEAQVCQLFSLKPDMFRVRRCHAKTVAELRDLKVNVPRHILASKSILGELQRINLESVRNKASKLAVEADLNSPQIRALVNDLNKLKESEAAKLALIEERSREYGVTRRNSNADTGGKDDDDNDGSVATHVQKTTSKAMRHWLKAASPLLRVVKPVKSFKDLGITDPDEVAVVMEHLKILKFVSCTCLSR